MKIDQYGTLVSEIWPEGNPGNLGDSMANTARWIHLRVLLGETDYLKLAGNLYPFRSRTGYLRSPDPSLPMDWRESDSSGDQCLPWYIAESIVDPSAADEMKRRIAANSMKTGNNNFVNPSFWAILNKNQIVLDLSLAFQALLFRFPLRWSDSKHNLEISADSSADVLNWFHSLPLASPWVKRLVTRDWIMNKINDYFVNNANPEPNVSWLIDLYDRATTLVFNG